MISECASNPNRPPSRVAGTTPRWTSVTSLASRFEAGECVIHFGQKRGHLVRARCLIVGGVLVCRFARAHQRPPLPRQQHQRSARLRGPNKRGRAPAAT